MGLYDVAAYLKVSLKFSSTPPSTTTQRVRYTNYLLATEMRVKFQSLPLLLKALDITPAV